MTSLIRMACPKRAGRKCYFCWHKDPHEHDDSCHINLKGCPPCSASHRIRPVDPPAPEPEKVKRAYKKRTTPVKDVEANEQRILAARELYTREGARKDTK